MTHTEEGFVAIHSEGSLKARKVVLATGIVDEHPTLAGADDLVKRCALRYCPVCDAFEAIDRRIAVIGPLERSIAKAVYLRTYSPDIVVLALGPDIDLSDERRASLNEAGIPISIRTSLGRVSRRRQDHSGYGRRRPDQD